MKHWAHNTPSLLIHSGVFFVGTHLDGLQTAVGLALAVVGALLHSAANGLVGGAVAAAHHLISHGVVPPSVRSIEMLFTHIRKPGLSFGIGDPVVAVLLPDNDEGLGGAHLVILRPL